MSVPESVDELLNIIRKSGMIEERVLSAFLQLPQYADGHLPTDVQEFVDEMIKNAVLTNFQAEQIMLGKTRGYTIGKYKLLERIGVGGMGQVFFCEHMTTKKYAAIKVLPPAKADQPAALGRFQREARAAAALDHPNIVRTHEIDQDGNLHFIVMDYIDGANLSDIVSNFGSMSLDRAVSYTRQIAVGLDYAYKNSIIHRDIKPANVLVDRKGVARILDMGLARFLTDHTDQLTVKYDDKIVLGTADFVAPEQVANSHAVDSRADIYALGSTLYFLLAGHPPFPTGTVSQKLLWHQTKDPTPIRTIRSDVPAGLAAVLAKMMAKEPKDRYQTPGQVVKALDEFMPASVRVPPAEEMPQLSPAAEAVLKSAPATARVGSAADTVKVGKLATAPMTAVKTSTPPASPSPFGSTRSSPWGTPLTSPPPQDEALPEAAEEVPDAPVPVPSRGSVTKGNNTRLWVVIGLVVLAVVAALVATKM